MGKMDITFLRCGPKLGSVAYECLECKSWQARIKTTLRRETSREKGFYEILTWKNTCKSLIKRWVCVQSAYVNCAESEKDDI